MVPFIFDYINVKEVEDEEKRIFTLEEKSLGKVIGHIIFHKFNEPLEYELGWIINRKFHGNGICDYKCDKLCTNCWSNEANVKGGLCNECEWNKYYSNKATCGGCTGNIVDGSLAGTIRPDCGYEFELIN